MITNRRQVYQGIPDEELVDRAQNGDQGAFTELIERHQSNAFKLALSILRDKADAEDEVQNACWKAFEHLRQFNRDAKFSTWFSRIVVNQCLMRLRKAKRARLLYMDDTQLGEEVVTLELKDDSPTPEDQLGEREVSEMLEFEINRIPPLLRKVFLLRDVEQVEMPEVAQRLGISVAAAKSRLLRARLELRERLRKHQNSMGAASLLR
jgi:RNA polymerase sigma-70 factor, ECF subfamily